MLLIKREFQSFNGVFQLYTFLKDSAIYFKAREIGEILKSKNLIKKMPFEERIEWKTLDPLNEYKTTWASQTIFVNVEYIWKLLEKSNLLPTQRKDFESWISETIIELKKLSKLPQNDLDLKIFLDALRYDFVKFNVTLENFIPDPNTEAYQRSTEYYQQEDTKIRIIPQKIHQFCFKILAMKNGKYICHYGPQHVVLKKVKDFPDYQEKMTIFTPLPLVTILNKLETTLYDMGFKKQSDVVGLGVVKLSEVLQALEKIRTFLEML
ncbi:hypothetical protein DLEV_092 [Diachasmimorpha longicaudata entomopoxvirus]|uniref:Bro-N domain-containing protein n=1 Tax=Diachasmimorpha longicaudata entomopoxvirus TaxID=109981 RepID=A0A7R5WJA0_9POXV|nr:hypothetical protein QKK69_gp092 [Diachasmimorpha longicaudata entomopoxvirus]AKS26383.1 hypothetical protein DLEV_092 [Diachasmimorpha longicaudata entomopoxvirus]